MVPTSGLSAFAGETSEQTNNQSGQMTASQTRDAADGDASEDGFGAVSDVLLDDDGATRASADAGNAAASQEGAALSSDADGDSEALSAGVAMLDGEVDEPSAPVTTEELIAAGCGLRIEGDLAAGDVELDTSERYVTVRTSKRLTVSNASDGVTDWGIVVPDGVKATLVLDGVNIAKRKSPIDIQTGGDLLIVLADGSDNRLENTYEVSDREPSKAEKPVAGIRCGEGSFLRIDDSVLNQTTAGKHITPEDGRIPYDAVLENGTAIEADDPLSVMESSNPGSLYVSNGRSYGAAIGGDVGQCGGSMTFDGGVVTAQSRNVYNGYSGDDYAAGIGAGGGAAGTGPNEWITINGGEIHAQGSYHGAGIGGGAAAHSSPDYRRLESRERGGSGNIRINGGYVVSTGGIHGAGFGNGCSGGAQGYEIVLTGGTLIPLGTGGFADVGGPGAAVTVTGGSLGNGTSGKKFLFQGTAQDDKGNQLQMISVDLTGKLGESSERIRDWQLLVDDYPYDYGAPDILDKGKLYLWLPANVVNYQEVTIQLSRELEDEDGNPILDENGEPVVVVEDAFVRSTALQQSSGVPSTDEFARQYLSFDLPGDYMDSIGQERIYDGKQLAELELPHTPPLYTSESDSGAKWELTDPTKVRYRIQRYSDVRGKPLGAAKTGIEKCIPDAGVYKMSLMTTQFAQTDELKNLYWGHSATGWVTVHPAESQIAVEGTVESGGNQVSLGDKDATVSPSGRLDLAVRVSPNYQKAAGNVDADGDGFLDVVDENPGSNVSHASESRDCRAPEGVVSVVALWDANADGTYVHQASLGSMLLRPALASGTAPDEKLWDEDYDAWRAAYDASDQRLDDYGYRYSEASFSLDLSTMAALKAFGGTIPSSFAVDARFAGADAAAASRAAAQRVMNYNSVSLRTPSSGHEVQVSGDKVDPADNGIVFRVAETEKPGTDEFAVVPDDGLHKAVGDSFFLRGQMADEDDPSDYAETATTWRLVDKDGNPVDSSDSIKLDPKTGEVTCIGKGIAYVEVIREADSVYERQSVIVPIDTSRTLLVVKDRDGSDQAMYKGTRPGTPVAEALDGKPTEVLADPSDAWKTPSDTLRSATAWAESLTEPGGPYDGQKFLGWTTDPATDELLTPNDAVADGTRTVYPVFGPVITVGPMEDEDVDLSVGKVVDGTASLQVGDVVSFALEARSNNLADLPSVRFADRLPAGLSVVPGTVRLAVVQADGSREETALAEGDYDLATFADSTTDDAGVRHTVERQSIGYTAQGSPNLRQGAIYRLEFDAVVSSVPEGGSIQNIGQIAGNLVESDELPVEGYPELKVGKSVENRSREDGVRVGDTLAYRVTLENAGGREGSLPIACTLVDPLPEGLAFSPGSAVLELADGTQVPVADEAWDSASRRLSVRTGGIAPGSSVALSFECTVEASAEGAALENVAFAVQHGPDAGDTPGDPNPEYLATPGNPEEPDNPDNPGNPGTGKDPAAEEGSAASEPARTDEVLPAEKPDPGEEPGGDDPKPGDGGNGGAGEGGDPGDDNPTQPGDGGDGPQPGGDGSGDGSDDSSGGSSAGDGSGASGGNGSPAPLGKPASKIAQLGDAVGLPGCLTVLVLAAGFATLLARRRIRAHRAGR